MESKTRKKEIMDKYKKITAKDTKIQSVGALDEKVKKAKTIAFVDYHGLTVGQVSSLRDKIREAGGEMTVAKNTLVKRALLINQLPDSSAELAGPTATVFAYVDEVAPIKAVAESIKSTGLPKFKFGFFGQNILDATGLENLARIPSRDILQGQVVGMMAAPLKGIVNVLNANIRNLAIVLDQISKKATN